MHDRKADLQDLILLSGLLDILVHFLKCRLLSVVPPTSYAREFEVKSNEMRVCDKLYDLGNLKGKTRS